MSLALDTPRSAFAVLGDRLRLRLACCLAGVRDGVCVCELVDALAEPQPNVSRQLKLMKGAGLVEEHRQGRWVYYRLRNPDHPFLKTLRGCIEEVCCCGDIGEDFARLRRRLGLRRGGKCVVGMEGKKRG